ncbi:hypothetical protein BDN70DRAFT_939490 [Pholiota conissans]|uniref:CxC2-like cysteine cluster KDZ transposase-associated domain-containing protein n=1 Tax=Pholiota conissans TaxID=109636 RepID=A0A9P6CL44_9AGAR|nr:hypothetical protein BDN70DRAFT_939490 [Pholiota conissans]
MSSSKRPSNDVLPGQPRKKNKFSSRNAMDPKASIRASSLRILSNGKVSSKKMSLKEETPQETAFDSTSLPVNDINDQASCPTVTEESPSEQDSGTRTSKQKQPSTNSSKLNEWLQFQETFLLEILRRYGLGDSLKDSTCASCHSNTGRFRCSDCSLSCLRCSECLVDVHRENPLHRIEEWNGYFFEKRQLKDLGLRIQLGHGGQPCPCPSSKSDFVVFHVNGFHRVGIDFCDCANPPHSRVQLLRMGWFPATFDRPKTAFTFDLLRLFQKVTLQGKTTLYDFYHAIVQLTDTLQLEKSTDRYTEFQRAYHLWRHLSSLKHAARGHDPAGAAATSQGELVIECPACPHPGKNLPEEWEDVQPKDHFLYTFFLAIDANFKLKQKERGITDIELAPGWGCYVESSRYDKHVNLHAKEADVNSCRSEHNAIARADTAIPGYAVNAVGLGLCSRHSLIRGNGVVDLRKGEKFCSMDYMVLSALAGVNVSRVLVSYDIGCQWSKNLQQRIAKYSDDLNLPENIRLEVGIPSWHVNGHGAFCRNNYSLSYLPGVGRTCGEDVEITWSQTNSLAPSTREMGPGARKETLNDHWNGWNLRKVVGFRTLFLKRFRDACMMRKKHAEIFQTFTETFKVETIAKWRKMVDDWIDDRTKPNPYEEPNNTTTLQDVRLELAKEDAEAASSGISPPHKISLTEFLTDGLELEEQQ